MNKEIKVNNIGNFEFWLAMFKPRTKQWQRKTLASLKKGKRVFQKENERVDKIIKTIERGLYARNN
jgi:hypothetical protein